MITLKQSRIDPSTIRTQINWLNDPEVVAFSDQRHIKHTVGTQYDYIRSYIEHPSNVLREIHLGDTMIGTISATIDTKNRIAADIGILIGPGYRKKGYGYEAWAALCDMLFDNIGVRRIEAGCMAANTPIIKVMQRYGMREEGRRISHFILNGTYSDLVLYGRFR